MNKPSWWPKNPYPESVFTMKEERYAEIVPDPLVRTGLSGMLGRSFWNIASEDVWEAMEQAARDECERGTCPLWDCCDLEVFDERCFLLSLRWRSS